MLQPYALLRIAAWRARPSPPGTTFTLAGQIAKDQLALIRIQVIYPVCQAH
jgi:hypothetical protein